MFYSLLSFIPPLRIELVWKYLYEDYILIYLNWCPHIGGCYYTISAIVIIDLFSTMVFSNFLKISKQTPYSLHSPC